MEKGMFNSVGSNSEYNKVFSSKQNFGTFQSVQVYIFI